MMSVELTVPMLDISKHTVVDWNNYMREIRSSKFIYVTIPLLDGIVCIIQIDEQVICRPKYTLVYAMTEIVINLQCARSRCPYS